MRSNAIKPLNPILSVNEEIETFSNIVALAVPKFSKMPLVRSDIVIVGRATDTAIISALPLLKKKIMEQAGMERRLQNVVLFVLPIHKAV